MAKPATTSRRTVGITNHPLQQERENQKRVPPKGKANQGTGMKSAGDKADRKKASPAARPQKRALRTIARRGVKGGKTSGSRAGLRSSNKKNQGT